MDEPSGYSVTGDRNLRQLPAAGTCNRCRVYDTDIGLMKNFHFTEGAYLQFRGDFLNAFNNVQLGHPNTNFPSADLRAGQYVTTRKKHPIRAEVLLLSA